MSVEVSSPTGAGLRPEDTPRVRVLAAIGAHPLAVLAVVLLALVLLTGAVEPKFLSVNGLRNTLLLAAPLGIMAGTQTVCMLTGGIDLSVAMSATAAAYVAGVLTPHGAPVAILGGLGVGLVIGLVNGVGVGVFKVNPLIMTLGMSAILVGLLTSLSQTILSGATRVAPFIATMGAGSFLGRAIPYNVLIWAVVAAALIIALKRSGWGRAVYAMGDNQTASRLAGIRSWQVLIAVYVLAGILAAFAGILLAGRSGSVDLQLAQNFLLPSVAAAVIGGTSIFGGYGSYSGTVFGALILGVLDSLLTFINAGEAVRQTLYGSLVLVLAWSYARVTANR
ncbi:MAG: ABC transporter permease [Cellulomonas sp.]